MITRYELLDDRVRVYYHLKTKWGTPDEEAYIDVLYKDITNLHPFPKEYEYEIAYDVYVPYCKVTITFRLYEEYETSACLEERMDGPFLRNKEVNE